MTPYSAAAGGSFSSRPSSRSACLRGSSGSSAASIRSRSSVISACCSSASPSSSWIAFICWRRKNSRWPLSISDSTCDWILVPRRTTSSSRVRISLRRRRRFADVDLLQQPLLLLDADAQRARDQVAQGRRVVEVGDRELELLGQIGDLLDDLAEGVLNVAGQRLELGRGLEHVGDRLDAGDQVGLLGHVVGDPDALAALDQDPQRAVGHLHHPRHGARDPDLVQVVGTRRVVPGVLRGDHRQHPVAREDVVHELDRALLADRKRGQRVREGDGLAQRQHGQRVRQGLARRGWRRRPRGSRRPRSRGARLRRFRQEPASRLSRCRPFLLSSALDRHLARRLLEPDRKLDPQDAVLVGGHGLARRRRPRTARPPGGRARTAAPPAGRCGPRSRAPGAGR